MRLMSGRGVHWENGQYHSPVRYLSFLIRFYCYVDIFHGALAKRARYDRVAVHPGALEPGSCHHFLHGGSFPPGYSWQQLP
jgi:hypothetical protein